MSTLKNRDFLELVESMAPDSKIVARATARYLASRTQSQREIFDIIVSVMQAGLSDNKQGLDGEVVIPDYLKEVNIPVFLEPNDQQSKIIETNGQLAFIPFTFFLRCIHKSFFNDSADYSETVALQVPRSWYKFSAGSIKSFVEHMNKDENPFVYKALQDGKIVTDVDGVNEEPIIITLDNLPSISDDVTLSIEDDSITSNVIYVDLDATLDYYTENNDDTMLIISIFECISNGVSSLADLSAKVSSYTSSSISEIFSRNGESLSIFESSKIDPDTSVSALISMVSDKLENDSKDSSITMDEMDGLLYENFTGSGGLHALFNVSSWVEAGSNVAKVAISLTRATTTVLKTGLRMLTKFVGKIWSKYLKPHIDTQDFIVNSDYDDKYIDVPIATSLMHSKQLLLDKESLQDFVDQSFLGEVKTYSALYNVEHREKMIEDAIPERLENGTIPCPDKYTQGGCSINSNTEEYTTDKGEIKLARMYDTGQSIELLYGHLDSDVTDIPRNEIDIRVKDTDGVELCRWKENLVGSTQSSYTVEQQIHNRRPCYIGETYPLYGDNNVSSDCSITVTASDICVGHKAKTLDFNKDRLQSYVLRLSIFDPLSNHQDSKYLRNYYSFDAETTGKFIKPDFYGPFSDRHIFGSAISLWGHSYVDSDGSQWEVPNYGSTGYRSLISFSTFTECFSAHDAVPKHIRSFRKIRISPLSSDSPESYSTCRCVNLHNDMSIVNRDISWDEWIKADFKAAFKIYDARKTVRYSVCVTFDDDSYILYHVSFINSSDNCFVSIKMHASRYLGLHTFKGTGLNRIYTRPEKVTAVPFLNMVIDKNIPCSIKNNVLKVGDSSFNLSYDAVNSIVHVGSNQVKMNNYDSAGSISYDSFNGVSIFCEVKDYPYINVPDCYMVTRFRVYYSLPDLRFTGIVFLGSFPQAYQHDGNPISESYDYDPVSSRFFKITKVTKPQGDFNSQPLLAIDKTNIVDTGSICAFDYGTFKVEFFQTTDTKIDYMLYLDPVNADSIFSEIDFEKNTFKMVFEECESRDDCVPLLEKVYTPLVINGSGNDVDKQMLINIYATNVFNELLFRCFMFPDHLVSDECKDISSGNFSYIALPSVAELGEMYDGNVDNSHLFRAIVSNGSNESSYYDLLDLSPLKQMVCRILFNRSDYMSIYNSIFNGFPDMIPYIEGQRFGVPRYHLNSDDDNDRVFEILIHAIVVALIALAAVKVVKKVSRAYKKKVSQIKSSRKVKQNRLNSEYTARETQVQQEMEYVDSINDELKKKDLSDEDRKDLIQMKEDALLNIKDLQKQSNEAFDKCFESMKKESLLMKFVPGYAKAQVATSIAVATTANLAKSVGNVASKVVNTSAQSSTQAVQANDKVSKELDSLSKQFSSQLDNQQESLDKSFSSLDKSVEKLNESVDSMKTTSPEDLDNAIDEVDTMLVRMHDSINETNAQQSASIAASIQSAMLALQQLSSLIENSGPDIPPNYTPLV